MRQPSTFASVLRVATTLGLVLTATLPALAQQDYLWPTDASKYLTSSFGEYRGRRFHAGIDIRTWGKTGYKVFAIRSGYVWRIGVSPYGYGKVLYVKLDTGETAVFAHLDRFSDKIQKLVEAEQERRQKYRVSIYPKPSQLPVEQGEIIAYSGQTGIGAPHLHFEIRDASNHPINPLSKNYRLPDTVSPIVRKISVTPLDARSQVNGDFEPVLVTPEWVGAGKYVLKKPLSIWGNIGLGISCFDKALNSASRYGVYSLKLYVDDVLRFEYAYDRMSFGENPMVEFERDYRLSRRRRGRFYKLYKDRHNRRNVYKPNRIWAGVLTSASLQAKPHVEVKDLSGAFTAPTEDRMGALFPGEHAFSIEVSDYFNNVTSVTGTVIVGEPYAISPTVEAEEDGQVLVRSINSYDLRRVEDLQAYYFTSAGWRPLPLRTMDPDVEKGGEAGGEWLSDGMEAMFVGHIPAKPVILKFVATDQFRSASYPYFYVDPDIAVNAVQPELDMTFDFYDDYARLIITTDVILPRTPRVSLYPGRPDSVRIALHQTGLKRYLGRLDLKKLQGRFHLLRIFYENLNGDRFTTFEQVEVNVIKPGKEIRLISDDHRFWVQFMASTLYNPFYGRITVDSVQAKREVTFVSNVYSVTPKDILLNKGAYVYFHVPRAEKEVEKLGVYYRARKGRWVFIDNKWDRATRAISAKILSFEDFALIKDATPPVITRLYPRPESHLQNRQPRLSAVIEDKLSGIRSENDVELWLDGRKLIAEYDPERKRVTYQVKRPLSVGRHEVAVVVRDKVNNSTSRSAAFWIN